MKRSTYTYDITATSTKKAAASTKKASASKETSSNETAQAAAAAASAPTLQSLNDAFGKRTKTPLGPKGELMVPQVLPSECFKAIEKLLLPPGWVCTIDATPERTLTLSNRRCPGLTAKQWKMREEPLSNGPPLEEDDANTPEEFICFYPPADEEDSNDRDEDGGEAEDGDGEARGSGNKESSADKKGKKKEAEAKEEALRKRIGKLASRHPDHLWDDYSLHVYNDFSWYGIMEVLENLRVLKFKSAQPLDVWREIEGLALLLIAVTPYLKVMCDDGERCEKVLELFGPTTIAAIDDSKFPSYPIMLSLLIKYAWSMGRGDYGFDDTVTWVFYVVQQAEGAGITLGEQTAASLSKVAKGTFTSKLKSYGSRGGDEFESSYGSAGGGLMF
ncbi:hypothetical protein V8C34DRAFT_318447 [Trichoderma compactum]